MARKLGIPWLPLAYDPTVLHPLAGTGKVWDWCFVGNLNARRRVAAVAALKAVFPNCFIGRAFGAEMNRIYNQSHLIATSATATTSTCGSSKRRERARRC